MRDWYRSFPEGQKGVEETLVSLRSLHERGAVLVCANEDKSPDRSEITIDVFKEDENGNLVIGEDGRAVLLGKRVVRDAWGRVEKHVLAHGRGSVLCYQPSTVGLSVADFDPMIRSRVSAIEEAVSPFRATFESSGTMKEAKGSRPAGKGGHGLWRAPIVPIGLIAEESKDESPRFFSSEAGGTAFGEFFYSHPTFGVIVWNALEWARVAEQGEDEEIDISSIPIAATPQLSSRKPDGSWSKAKGSRHDAALSEVSQAAKRIRDKDEFEEAIAEIEERFVASFDPSTESNRTDGKEWARIADDGRRKWKSDRKAEEDAQERTRGVLRNDRKEKEGEPPANPPMGRVLLQEKDHLRIREAIESVLGGQIRRNNRSRTIEIKMPSEEDWADWKEIDDQDYNRLRGLIYDQCAIRTGPKKSDIAAFKIGKDALIDGVAVAWGKKDDGVDPFKQYLDRCASSAPSPDLDGWMEKAGMQVANADREFVRWVCRYLFLAPVQRTFEPGCELEEIPLLIGQRGSGKSSACGWLLPKDMRESDLFNEGFYTSPKAQVMMEVTGGTAINEWQELNGIGDVPVGELKNYLSRRKDKARAVYDRKPTTAQRDFVIIGTTNVPDIPNDPALKRRFVAVYVTSGDVGRIRAYLDANRESLWSAGVAAYMRGERANLPHTMLDRVDENNEGSVKVDIHLREVILGTLRKMGWPNFFTKHDYCAAAGVFLRTDMNGNVSPITDLAGQAKERDTFWKKSGAEYQGALREIGFNLVKHPKRGFTLEDGHALSVAKSDGRARDPAKAASGHQSGTHETTAMAGPAGSAGSLSKTNNSSKDVTRVEAPPLAEVGVTPPKAAESAHVVSAEVPRVPPGRVEPKWSPPDDLDGEEG